MMLVDGLPQDSATVVSVRGEEYFGWSVTDEILADLWDLTITGLMAGAKKKPPKYPRPGDVKKQREKRKATSGGPAGILAMLPPDVRAAHEAARAARRKG